MFLALIYGIARGGRELNERKIWEWKRLLLEDSEKPIMTVLGLDMMDLGWALSIIACVGAMNYVIILFLAICKYVVEYFGIDEGSDRNRRSCLDDLKAKGADVLTVIVFLAVIVVFGPGTFVIIYVAIAMLINRKALNWLKKSVTRSKP
ncbi:hypothetical protein BGZ65_001728 [Modicella reniformis]|uniref:Uncharacterized protein n=1 Tax=Modicella reniformis TaxID=1440133 RepID=A0A9P6SU28_9FUNG|nr:hypothetical protein BGZ65_001728 [Modicella reniformis]